MANVINKAGRPLSGCDRAGNFLCLLLIPSGFIFLVRPRTNAKSVLKQEVNKKLPRPPERAIGALLSFFLLLGSVSFQDDILILHHPGLLVN